MKKNSFFVLIFTSLALASCSESNPVLTIEGGKVIGIQTPTTGITAYKGIPFAAPPIGNLRWKEPQPVIQWDGVKKADTYGAASMQTAWDPKSFYGREWRASGSVPFSEDCLYLNVWTPAAGKADKKLPVAMWIHGGGYREGFGFEPEMDGGEDWASRGVILVSVTYRLGILGFFAHPLLTAESAHGVSGNYGLLDIVAALKWINKNIEQFGGDPNNITVFGQSAGAAAVQSLCSSPLSKSMISHAISMSGGGLSNARPGILLDTAQLAYKKMMDYFKKTSLDEMRALSFDELVKMSSEYSSVTKKRLMGGVVIDNYFSTGTFTDVALANGISDIPYMFGYTANDMGDDTKTINDFCTLRVAQSSKPAYAYLFARALPGDDNGAWHSSDLWYVFHSFRHSWRPFTKGDEALSLQMVDFYTNFAKSGNPNGTGNSPWTPYSTALPKFMIFNADVDKSTCQMSDSPQYNGPSARK